MTITTNGDPTSSSDKKLCIIGGGSSGISLLPLSLQHSLIPTLYETRSSLGGAWIVDKEPGIPLFVFDQNGQVEEVRGNRRGDWTPMYEGLRTNVPTVRKRVAFDCETSFESRTDQPLFPSPEPITEYLQSVAAEYTPYIKLSRRVTSLRHTKPQDGGEQRRWVAEIENSETGQVTIEKEQFDFVAIANGHYTKPYVPPIPGLNSFKGELWHSKWWRSADAFKAKTVLVVGNGASGYDISRELAQSLLKRRQDDPSSTLPKLYQSTRSVSAMGIALDDPTAPEWTKEIKAFPPIKRINGNLIEFIDGKILEDVDLIIFATGYYFYFPFASPSHEPFRSHPLTISASGGLRVHHLDSRDVFYHPDPTLALLGLPYLVLPFPLAQIQSLLCSHHWSNSAPSLEIVPGTAEDAPEDRKALVYGHPKQFDLHDHFLQEMGKGEKDDGLWEKTPAWVRDLRMGSKALRRAVLGY